MSTPPRTHGSEPSLQPPKTPGWGTALFGLLSTTKKSKPVEASTDFTVENARPSPLRTTRHALDFSQPPAFTNHAVASLSEGVGSSAPPTALSTPAKTMQATIATKSVWASPAVQNGVRFSHGTGRKNVSSKKKPPVSAKRRAKTFRPMSKLLVQPQVRRTVGSIDATLAVSALERSKGAFALSTRQIEVTKNYTSFKTGRRLLGANQRGSRLPPPTDTNGPENGDEPSARARSGSDFGNTGQKKVKVSFDERERNRTATLDVSTPARIEMPRKGTPFKKRDVDEENKCVSSLAPPPPRETRPALVLSPMFNDAVKSTEIGNPIATDSVCLFDCSVATVGTTSNQNKPTLFSKANFDACREKAAKEDHAKRKNATSQGDGEAALKRPKHDRWKCQNCEEMNPDDETLCLKCSRTRPKTGNEGWGNMFKRYSEGKWICESCKAYNPDDLQACPACTAARPGASGNAKLETSSKSAPAPAATISKSGFTFGSAATSSKSEFSNTSTGFSFGSQPPSGSATANSIGFTFGAPPASAEEPAASTGFTFGTASSQSKPLGGTGTDSGSGFSFGATAKSPPSTNKLKKDSIVGESLSQNPSVLASTPTNTSEPRQPQYPATEPSSKRTRGGMNGELPMPKSANKASDSKPFSLAQPDVPEEKSKTPAPFTFGATKPAAPASGTFSFNGASSASSVSAANETSKPGLPVPSSSFGSDSKSGNEDRSKRSRDENADAGGGASGASAPSGANLSAFGSNSADTAPTQPAFKFGTSPGLFGIPGQPKKRENEEAASTVPLSTSTTSAPSFSFGSTPIPPSSEPPAAQNPFGSTSTSTPAGGTFSFGSAPKPATAPAASFSFGGNSSASEATQMPGFGSNTAPAGPVFGASGPSPAPMSSTPGPSFGSSGPAQSTQTPGFGSAPIGAPTPGAQNSMFPAPAANPFGGTSATPAPAPNFSFGNTAPVPAFGAAAPPSSAPAPTFGTAPTTAPPGQGFGAPPAPSNGGMFGGTPAAPAPPFFGGSTNPDPFGGGAPGQAPAATFGFVNSAPAPPQPGMGGYPMQQPGGFGGGGGGFGAPANPVTPGVGFSIGSGGGKSTGPRRRIVRAKRPGAGAPRQA